MRKAEQSARTRAAVMSAAVRLFGERGYRATSLKAIGGEAGISHGVIPFHFGSKDGLLRAVVEDCLERFQAAVLAPLADRPRDFGLGDLRTLVDALLAFQREHAEVGRLFHILMFEAMGPSPELRPHFREFHARMRAVGAAWMRAGQERGSIDAELHVEPVVDALLCFFSGLRTHTLLLEEGAIDPRVVHGQMLEILERALGPTRG